MNDFCDPGFHYSTALVKILSLFTIEMSSAPVLPFRMSEISAAAVDKMSNANVRDPHLDSAISIFDRLARNFESKLEKHKNLSEDVSLRLNHVLMQTMQSFLIDEKPFAERN